MVSSGSIMALTVNIVICFALPIGCLIYLIAAKKHAVIPVLVGAAVFTVFQLILRVPLLSALSGMDWYTAMAKSPWLYGVFLGLTAGIFEEVGRYIGYRTLLKKYGRWIDGFAFGVGHGGMEAVVLVGLTNISNLALAFAINNGSFDKLATMLPADTGQQIVSQLTGATPFYILLGGVERIFAFAIQIALSILVLYAVVQRKPLYLLLAVLAHMLVDAPVVILPGVFNWNAYEIEAALCLIAVLAVVFIVLSRRLFKKLPENPKLFE